MVDTEEKTGVWLIMLLKLLLRRDPYHCCSHFIDKSNMKYTGKCNLIMSLDIVAQDVAGGQQR